VEIAGVDCVDGNIPKPLLKPFNLLFSAGRYKAVILSVNAPVEVALRFGVPDEINICHVS
jgi:hypothetical protein